MREKKRLPGKWWAWNGKGGSHDQRRIKYQGTDGTVMIAQLPLRRGMGIVETKPLQGLMIGRRRPCEDLRMEQVFHL